MSASAQSGRATIEPARWPEEVPLARKLFLEYAGWLDIDLCFQGFEEELADLPGGYAPPDGGLWFARVDGEVAGVVGLRPFGPDGRRHGACEMKRLWVRPAFRGLGLGRRLADQTLTAARSAGYRRMRLDTLQRMAEARALYASYGFRDVTARVADPHPELVYMELDLVAAGAIGAGGSAERYFENFTVGERFVSRGATFTAELITGFARAYDPQPFHIDEKTAADSPYGGLIASGFQTLALAFRLFYQEDVISACSLGSPGLDRVRWHRPVRPGDTIRTEAEVRQLRPSGSKPDRGYLTMFYTVRNQDEEVVLSFQCTHILRRRPAGADSRA